MKHTSKLIRKSGLVAAASLIYASAYAAAVLPLNLTFDDGVTGTAPVVDGLNVEQGEVIIVANRGVAQSPALLLKEGTVAGQVSITLTPATTFGNIAWVDLRAKPKPQDIAKQFIDCDGMLIALVKRSATEAEIVAYDGKSGSANGSGEWIATGEKIALGTDGYPTDFARFTLRADYAAKRFDLLVNGKLCAANLGFDDARITKPGVIDLFAETDGALLVDNIAVTAKSPLDLPADSDDDGINDALEIQYGMNPNDASDRLRNRAGDGVPDVVKIAMGYSPSVDISTTLFNKRSIPGVLSREVWTGISGNYVTNLVNATNDFLKPAQLKGFVAGSDMPRNWADNYGERIRGFVTLPVDGVYRFAIAGDDNAKLLIAEDGDKLHRAEVATVPAYSGFHVWNAAPGQISATIQGKAGQRIYVEMQHKEGGGADHLSLGWIRPGTTAVESVPVSALNSFVLHQNDQDDDDLPDSWEMANGLSPTDNGGTLAGNGKHGDKDGDGLENALEYALGTNPASADVSALAGKSPVPGVFLREVWTGLTINAADAANLWKQGILQRTPATVNFAKSVGRQNAADAFGERLRALFTPPTSGYYSFRITGDDGCELYLSDTDKPVNKRRIARLTGWASTMSFPSWDQVANSVYLEAGKSYYM